MTTEVRPRRRSRRARQTREVWRAIATGLSAGFLGLIVLLAAIVIVIPKVAGATPMTVLTSSMEPTLPPGTLIVSKPVAPSKIHVGDVMTYQIKSGEPAVISHRVIEVRSRSDGTFTFITKGDNNDAADPEVVQQQVRGVLWYSVPLLGYVNSALTGEQRIIVVPIVAGLLFCYALYMVITGIIAAVRKRRAATPR
ncbi:signal peptidase I [Microbacterium sp. STN6]|uniref:signal peptidase I n=1 Tax=Microbacterium sp. STN6 TaxID=2995588 RepID=UPI002260FC5D|nr:signal peptidase I [Microbacterium sp. STN6]MCX7522914.1 signal peptidase I [Microbacterium sp. STN6]